MEYIDMHTHTTASDGVYTPIQLIDYAIEKGLNGLAITDHDTIEGLDEAIDYSKTKRDFFLLPGIELSTEYLGEEVHILGYSINYRNTALLNLLKTIKNQRRDRVIKIVNKLKDLNIDISYEEVSKLAGEGAMGRPHVARVLNEKGYVSSTEAAFEEFLNKDRPAYVSRFKLTPIEAIDMIKKTEGFVSIAHPGLIGNEEILAYLLSKNIDGIEVYHPEHNEKEKNRYLNIAQEHNLIITGGSDFHNPPEHKANRHGDLGSEKVKIRDISKLLSK